MGLQGPVTGTRHAGTGLRPSPPAARRVAAWVIAATVASAAVGIGPAPSAAVLMKLDAEAGRLETASARAAAVRRGTDTEARIRFRLDDRVLVVRVLRQAPRATRRALYGRRIEAVCGTDFNFTRGIRVRRTRAWPSGRKRVRYRFRRNISRRARWCLLERRAGGDVAFASLSR